MPMLKVINYNYIYFKNVFDYVMQLHAINHMFSSAYRFNFFLDIKNKERG